METTLSDPVDHREYYLACWLAGVKPEEIIAGKDEKKEILRAYIFADLALMFAQVQLRKG